MLYSSIVSRLTESQKVRLLTDIRCLSETEFRTLGLPVLRLSDPGALGAGRYPSLTRLAASWDRGLFAEVVGAMCRAAAAQGVNLVALPGPKIRLSPYETGLSEDACLSAELSAACLGAAADAGVAAAAEGYDVQTSETDFLDDVPRARTVAELIVRPFRIALSRRPPLGVVTVLQPPDAAYAPVNRALADTVADGRLVGGGHAPPPYALCASASPQDTVPLILGGKICLSGSAAALQDALDRHRALRADIRRSRATTSELEAEVRRGTAVSEEVLDEAVDRLLAFAFACAAPAPGTPRSPAADPQDLSALRRRAARASIVLLRNRSDLLPLRRGRRRICLVGDLATACGAATPAGSPGALPPAAARAGRILTERGYVFGGYAQGYDGRLDRDPDDSLRGASVGAAAAADTVVLFLGTTPSQELRVPRARHLLLPANQMALADRLSAMGKRVVAVVSAEYAPDLAFAEPFDALLLAPLSVPDGLDAVLDVLTGDANPSGRLTGSLCADAEQAFRKRRAYRRLLNRQVGPFIGYRYGDAEGRGDLYPLGHGLSYTEFRYGGLRVADGRVSFTVRNAGRRAGVETAQLYLGKPDSAVLRARRELVAFERVELGPGERRTLSVPIDPAWAAVWDEAAGRFATEGGAYELSIGASLLDIRLRGRIRLEGAALPPDGEPLCRYLPSESNIRTEGYTLEAKPMQTMQTKKPIRNTLTAAASILLSISVKTYSAMTGAGGPFWDLVAGVLAVGAIVFLILEATDRRKRRAAEREEIDRLTEAQFADADRVASFSADQLFVSEFDEPEAGAGSAAGAGEAEPEDGIGAGVREDLTFAAACGQFAAFAAEQGVAFGEAAVRSLFASLAASRLIVVRDMADGAFETFVRLLDGYFGCPFCLDVVDETYRSEADVLFETRPDGARAKRGVARAMEHARANRDVIHVAALSHASLAGLSDYFAPFAGYVRSPADNRAVTILGDRQREVSYRVPRNLWFVLQESGGEPLSRVPGYIGELASIGPVEFSAAVPSDARAERSPFGFRQLEYLTNRAKAAFEPDEGMWRRIDRLEEYAAARAEFRIGNKLWTGLETYLAVSVACGSELPAALDAAIARRLLPSVVAALSGRIGAEDRGLGETLDAVFGEDAVAESRRTVRESGADLV